MQPVPCRCKQLPRETLIPQLIHYTWTGFLKYLLRHYAGTRDKMVNLQKKSLPSWSCSSFGTDRHQTSPSMNEQENNRLWRKRTGWWAGDELERWQGGLYRGRNIWAETVTMRRNDLCKDLVQRESWRQKEQRYKGPEAEKTWCAWGRELWQYRETETGEVEVDRSQIGRALEAGVQTQGFTLTKEGFRALQGQAPSSAVAWIQWNKRNRETT